MSGLARPDARYQSLSVWLPRAFDELGSQVLLQGPPRKGGASRELVTCLVGNVSHSNRHGNSIIVQLSLQLCNHESRIERVWEYDAKTPGQRPERPPRLRRGHPDRVIARICASSRISTPRAGTTDRSRAVTAATSANLASSRWSLSTRGEPT